MTENFLKRFPAVETNDDNAACITPNYRINELVRRLPDLPELRKRFLNNTNITHKET